ncbi:hypothetical protein VOLCADRAFT_100303 [Volvox carteri f. nagariensis]|uniref:Uncharacterized protein n=1 Tax=Volvox carteri f. nagariensis TaxID=3068 RepID=D8UJY6_VOLCA|nr:uncharacterized protein VOLCADRAFT_100303 [Volvox carteri f. nagariensis]EFJ39946.1 hypothetical protein VOLCADRAFT_100303 [Volvox carteri f. nagariensis]|eukprot:XP_002958971.1 hypothetical protein VOLCADRAFT_100303 [Volvox carteri f. nagariensis]
MLNARPRKRKRPRRRQGGGARLGEALGMAGAGAPQQRIAAEDGAEERPLPPRRRRRRLYDSSGGGADVAVTKNPGQLNSSSSSEDEGEGGGKRASAAAAALRAAYDTVSGGKEAPPSVSEVSWDLGSCSTANTTACDGGEEAEEGPKRMSGSSGGDGSSSSSKGGVPESGGDSSSDASDGGGTRSDTEGNGDSNEGVAAAAAALDRRRGRGRPGRNGTVSAATATAAVAAAAAGAGGGRPHGSSKIRGDHLDLFSELDRLFMASGPAERRPAGVYGVVRQGRAASGGGAAAARRSGRVLAAAVGGGGGGGAAAAPLPPPPGPAATLTSKVALRSQVLERLRSAVTGHHLETRATLPPQGVRRTAAAAAAAAATPSSTVAARRVTLPGLQQPPPSSTRQPPPPLPQPPPQPSKATRPPDDNPLAYLLYLKHTRQAVLVVAAGDLGAVRSLAAHPVSKLLRRAPSGLLLAVTHVAAAEVTWQRRYRQLAERQLPGPHVWLKPAATAATTAAAAAVPPPPLAGLGHLGSARVTMRLNAVAPAIFPLPYELRVRQCAAAARRGVASEDVGERGVDAVDRQLEDNIAAAATATAAAREPAALREVLSNAGDKPTEPSPQPLHGQRQQPPPPPPALAEPEDRPQLQLVAERDEPREGTEPAATATTVVGNGHVAVTAAAAAVHRPMGRKANGDRHRAAGIITQRRNTVKSRVASLLDTLTATCVVVQHGGGCSGGGGGVGGTGGKSRGFSTSNTDDDSSSSSSSGSGGEQERQQQIQKEEKKHECQRLVAAAVLVHWWDDGPGDGGGGGGRLGNDAAAAADLVPEQMLPPVAEVQRRLLLERRDTGLLQMLQVGACVWVCMYVCMYVRLLDAGIVCEEQQQHEEEEEGGRTAGGSSSGGGGLTAEEELAAAAAAYGTPEHTGGVMRPSYSYALYPENELRALPPATPPVFGWQCGSNVGGGGAGGGDAVLHSLRRNSDVYGNRLHSPWPAASHGPHGAWTGQPIPLPCLKSRDLLYTSARPVVCKGCTTFTCLSLLQLDRPPLRAAFIHRHCYSSAVFHRWKLRPHDRGLYTANHIPVSQCFFPFWA